MKDLRKLARGKPCQIADESERWRPVLEWEGLYEVSNLGRVRSISRWVAAREGKRLIEGRILKAQESLGMYWRVELTDGERIRSLHVHRLVALAFVIGTGDVVRHLDGDGFNNVDSNLAWGSHADNEADKDRHGRVPRGLQHGRAALTKDQLQAIRELHSRGFSQVKIAKATGTNRGTVGYVVRGETYVND